MAKIKEDKLNALESEFGFNKYKVNREESNYYYAFGKDKLLLIVNNLDYELKLEKLIEGDVRIHKKVNLHSKSNLTVVDLIANLVKKDVLKEEENNGN